MVDCKSHIFTFVYFQEFCERLRDAKIFMKISK